MASLPGLPNELLFMICDVVHPPKDFSRGSLGGLAALARTNKRLSSVINPLLYERGVQCHAHLPLLWAAKVGKPETLRKALAAGANPNHTVKTRVSRKVWNLANGTLEASRAWADDESSYWPPLSQARAASLKGQDARWGRDMTPTMTEFDVYAAASAVGAPQECGNGVEEQHGYESSSESSSDSELDDEAPPRGIDLGKRVPREYTALHIAAKEGHNNIIRILLDCGADIDSVSRGFCGCESPRGLWTTLMCAPIVGPDRVPSCRFPLHLAICCSRPETAKLLISRGARVIRQVLSLYSSSYCALFQAAALGHADLLSHILDTHPDLDVDHADFEGLTAFYFAYANGRWDSTIPLLLSRGADINVSFEVCNPYDEGVVVKVAHLGEACRLGRFDDALKLIDLGADVSYGVQVLIDDYWERFQAENAEDESDEDPEDVELTLQTRIPLLHMCCMDFSRDCALYPLWETIWGVSIPQASSRPKLIARLLAAGTSPDEPWVVDDGHKETPLFVAIRHLNVPAVKALVAAGADVNAHDSEGRNALMCTALGCDCATCRNALRDEGGGDWGRWRFLPPRQQLFQSFPPRPSALDSLIAREKYPRTWRIARLLLDAGASVNHQDSKGNTILHLLFLRPPQGLPFWEEVEPQSRMPLLRLLLARGSDPCIRNAAGASALQIAVEGGNTDVLKMISVQCRIDIVDTVPRAAIVTVLDGIAWAGNRRRNHCMLGWRVRRTPPRSVPSTEGAVGGEAAAAAVEQEGEGPDVDEVEGECIPYQQNVQRSIDALMDMDISGRLAAQVPSILLTSPGKLWRRTDMAEILCYRALEKATFKPAEKLALLHAAITGRRWPWAHRLLSVPPETIQVNHRDADDHSLLSLVTSSDFHRNLHPDVDILLVEAGADIHLRIGPAEVVVSSPDLSVMTPLKFALMRPDAFHIDLMLRKQPIRGNPQAAEPLYLHWAVSLPWRPALHVSQSKVPWRARDASIRALLAGGADTRQLDPSGDTAWLRLLRQLLTDTDNVEHTCHWFKPLSRGVDITLKNDAGCSVVDYLEEILAEPRAADIIGNYLQLATLENGEKEIRWLK